MKLKLFVALSMITLSSFAMQQDSRAEFKVKRLEEVWKMNPDFNKQYLVREAQKKIVPVIAKVAKPYVGPKNWDLFRDNHYFNDGKLFALADCEAFVTVIYQAEKPFDIVAKLESPDIPWGDPALAVNNQQQLAAISGQEIIIWDLQKYQQLAVLKGHTDLVSSIAFHPNDATQLISGSYDTTIKAWDLRTKESQTIQAGNSVDCVDIRPGGSGQIAAAISFSNSFADGALNIYSLVQGGKLASLKGGWSTKYTHAGTNFITSLPGNVVFYDANTFEEVRTLELPGEWSKLGAEALSYNWTEDDSKIVISGLYILFLSATDS